MSEKTRYIGISFGPITRILSYAKNTRSIWASSYLFSYLAKQTIKHYYQHDKQLGNRKFLTPAMNDVMFTKVDGVGRFSDQYVFEALPEDTLNSVRKHVDDIVLILARNILSVLHPQNMDENTMVTYLNNTLRILILEKEYDHTSDKKRIVEDMQQNMSVMECRDTFCSKEYHNYLADYLASASNDSLLIEDTLANKNGIRIFSSILECSVGNDLQKYKDMTQKYRSISSDIEKLIEMSAIKLKPYQKYIAFVSADGDNFGKTLAKLGTSIESTFVNFSDRLNAEVTNYGGQVIYQGGDDIFFFAPISNNFKKESESGKEVEYNRNIFDLIESIDNIFNDTIGKADAVKEIESNLKPSLSYSIAMAYYKFPMDETKVESERMLDEIKNIKLKNRIKWSVRRHSGQTFGDTIEKSYCAMKEVKKEEIATLQQIDKQHCNENQQIHKEVKNELTNYMTLIHKCINKDDGFFLHSVTHWVNYNKPILSIILKKNGTDNRKECLSNFFSNNFNESIHDDFTELFVDIQDFLLFYTDDKGIDKLHALLRYISLLIKKEDKCIKDI